MRVPLPTHFPGAQPTEATAPPQPARGSDGHASLVPEATTRRARSAYQPTTRITAEGGESPLEVERPHSGRYRGRNGGSVDEAAMDRGAPGRFSLFALTDTRRGGKGSGKSGHDASSGSGCRSWARVHAGRRMLRCVPSRGCGSEKELGRQCGHRGATGSGRLSVRAQQTKDHVNAVPHIQ